MKSPRSLESIHANEGAIERHHTREVIKKLDRVLINEQWSSFIKDSRVENLPIIGSDHGPIVLHLKKRIWESKARPFRCEEFWFHILGFSDIVKEAWSFHFTGFNAF